MLRAELLEQLQQLSTLDRFKIIQLFFICL